MPDYRKHSVVIDLLRKAQDADQDNRARVREIESFLHQREGQWEQQWIDATDGRPRYTFDLTNPIVDQIASEIEQAAFEIEVSPITAGATKEVGKVIDGIVRNIQSRDNAVDTFVRSARKMVANGMDGWRVVQKYSDDHSFDQELGIEAVYNFVDRVWFDIASEKQDRSDARFCFILTALARGEFKERYPNKTEMSVSQDKNYKTTYWNKPDMIMVGEFLYKKEVKRDIVLFSNNAVLVDDENFSEEKIKLELSGVTEVRRRTRRITEVHSRKFSESQWLSESKKTVFSDLPVIPVYGNFSIIDNKVTYWGAVDKLLDPQRVFNYALSRQVEEAALSPRPKTWLTEDQAAGYEDSLETLNTNNEPVQFYNVDKNGAPPPYKDQPTPVNPGVLQTATTMNEIFSKTSGLFAANMGDNPNAQSGVAIRMLQDKGDAGTIKYFRSQRIAIAQTGKVIVDALPKVYDTEREIRTLNIDGSFEMITVNETQVKGGKKTLLNDLKQGRYDVVCTTGPSFKNRQQETVAALTEASAVNPQFMQLGGDIFLKNIESPGMDQLAERVRQQLFEAGAIPKDQLTEEEKKKALEEYKESQRKQQQDAATMIAQAEQQKAQAETLSAQAEAEKKLADIQMQVREADVSLAEKRAKIAQDERKIEQEQQKIDFDQLMRVQEMQMKQQKEVAEAMTKMLEDRKLMADTLKTIREAMGVDAIVGPNNTEAYSEQAEDLKDSLQ